MKKKCAHCGEEFEPASGKQKFCSDRCRVANARAKNKGPEVVAPDHEKILLGLMEDPAVLSVLLLKHPRPQMVRSCCLHYLGDGYQQIDAFLITQGWTPQDLLAIVQKRADKMFEKGKKLSEQTVDKTKGYDPLANPRARAAMGLRAPQNDKDGDKDKV